MVIKHLLNGMIRQVMTPVSQHTPHDLNCFRCFVVPWDERYIYLHVPLKSTIHVGKYTVRPMDPMGCRRCPLGPKSRFVSQILLLWLIN